MTAAFDEIAKLLLKLDVNELAEVRARAGILIQAGGAKARTSRISSLPELPEPLAETDIELVLGEIAGHLRAEGIEFASIPMLRRMNNYKSFAAKVGPTMIYFRKVTTNRTKLRALIRISIKLLYKDLASMQVSASTRTMMNHWHRVPAVINKNFPGYARAGYLTLLLTEA